MLRAVLLQLPQRVVEELLEALEGVVLRDVPAGTHGGRARLVIGVDGPLHQDGLVVLAGPDLHPLQLEQVLEDLALQVVPGRVTVLVGATRNPALTS